MARAYICGVLIRNKDNMYELNRLGVYGAPSRELTIMSDMRYCDFLRPVEAKTFGDARDKALAIAYEYAKYLSVEVDGW